ncbi:MAG: methylated-DNA--[protein]-cysteine S-methyltransferase [Betaproteobacteria bacterium]|nr:cysteine methyltransferase [Comamonadaceae bacterium]MCL5968983.1 methylated-DNA--[protein]-cysteine S-methyltransferase [Betaproteobacteria bacterium]OYX58342.1 MAG: hypothetical protein B7Y96_06240 [Comamonadaceae bacterium 32-67-11]OZA91321.1 MAG: hypothetical protein B7X56_00195 [Burkholderiales bacterium 34-67-9]
MHQIRLTCPIGELLLVAQPEHLLGVWFADQSGIPAWATVAAPNPELPLLCQTALQLEQYFAGVRQRFDLPLDLSRGSAFEQAVWGALAGIAPGQVCSYLDIARAIGRPRAARAVGGALGRNPIGIVLPCHRVLGSKGQLTGYTGGVARKQALLDLEARWAAA